MSDHPTFRNIEVNQLTVAQGDEGNLLFLVLRFFDFDLSYSVGLEGPKSIADGMARAASNQQPSGQSKSTHNKPLPF